MEGEQTRSVTAFSQPSPSFRRHASCRLPSAPLVVLILSKRPVGRSPLSGRQEEDERGSARVGQEGRASGDEARMKGARR